LQENQAQADEQILALSLHTKLREQIEGIQKLLVLLTNDNLNWQAQENSFRIGDLLGHLLECLAGFCAVLYALRPDDLKHFQRLRDLPVNHFCATEEAQHRIMEYQSYIEEGFGKLHDKDLTKKIPTLFVKTGETAMTILLGNLEHLINHKYQFFIYLKLLGIPVSSENLYYFRNQ
jgi:hypothetical protein